MRQPPSRSPSSSSSTSPSPSSSPSTSPSPPDSPVSPLNQPNFLLQTALHFLNQRNFRQCRHFAAQLSPAFPGAAQLLAIAYESPFPINPYRILQLPNYTRNLSLIADQFKKLMDLVTGPSHPFPFADEAEQHLLQAYSRISKPNLPVKILDHRHHQERILINEGGLIKNQQRVLINEGGLIKNLDDDDDDDDDNDDDIRAGVGIVVEEVDQEKKNDDHIVLGDQKDREENPKRRKFD